jgi:hypothetical protein
MPPIRLTDEQLNAILHAARPLAVRDRDPFLQDVAAALQGNAAPGDGDVHRAILALEPRVGDHALPACAVPQIAIFPCASFVGVSFVEVLYGD